MKRHIAVAAVVLGIMAAIIAGAFIYVAATSQPDDEPGITAAEPPAQGETVAFSYRTSTAGGIPYSVEETVYFGEDGECMASDMVLTFDDANDAQAFAESDARDYGSSISIRSITGDVVELTMDVSALRLDREEYRNALAYTVQDLTVSAPQAPDPSQESS